VNGAPAWELRQLRGIGETLAERIVSHRPYVNIEHLQRAVPGFGDGKRKTLGCFLTGWQAIPTDASHGPRTRAGQERPARPPSKPRQRSPGNSCDVSFSALNLDWSNRRESVRCGLLDGHFLASVNQTNASLVAVSELSRKTALRHLEANTDFISHFTGTYPGVGLAYNSHTFDPAEGYRVTHGHSYLGVLLDSPKGHRVLAVSVHSPRQANKKREFQNRLLKFIEEEWADQNVDTIAVMGDFNVEPPAVQDIFAGINLPSS